MHCPIKYNSIRMYVRPLMPCHQTTSTAAQPHAPSHQTQSSPYVCSTKDATPSNHFDRSTATCNDNCHPRLRCSPLSTFEHPALTKIAQVSRNRNGALYVIFTDKQNKDPKSNKRIQNIRRRKNRIVMIWVNRRNDSGERKVDQRPS